LLVAACLLGTVIFAAHGLIDPVANGEDLLFGLWLYNGVILLAGIACFLRAARVREERAAWISFGLAQLCWVTANLIYTFFYASDKSPPYPSAADAFWLTDYVLYIAGFILLGRSRRQRLDLGTTLDIAIGVAALATLYVAVVITQVLDGAQGYPLAALLTNLSYPICDFALIATMIVFIGIGAQRLRGELLALTIGFVLFALGDGGFLVQGARGTYVFGGVIEISFLAAAVAIAAATALPPARVVEASLTRRRRVAIPLVGGTIATAVLIEASIDGTHPVTMVLAAATLGLVLARTAIDRVQIERLLRTSEVEARTDALTGLANRRSLIGDLGARIAAGEPSYLALLDLNGFKHYNDTYGHAAGDGLLRRIACSLERASAASTQAYRLGGDEFCLLGHGGDEGEVGAVAAAVVESGERFVVTASFGSASCPAEASDATDVLRLADRRMYAAKDGRRESAGRQSVDVLIAALEAHDPDLGRHVADVATLAVSVGRRLGINAGELNLLRTAAALHDIGKLAIPHAILRKPEHLDEDEWEFMRLHTVFGEKIVGSAPALAPAGAIIRATHERFDGAGYPDGLAGGQIPLAARIVFVCDAYDAMTQLRPYRRPLTASEALAELRRCAGTQFDPEVVEAFSDVISVPELAARPADLELVAA
jgi:diguanylate cyclase (GGDEF)-like protein